MNATPVILGIVIIALTIVVYIFLVREEIPEEQPLPEMPTMKDDTRKTWCRIGLENRNSICAVVPSSDLCGSGMVFVSKKACEAAPL